MVQSVRRYEDRDPSPNVLMWFEAAIKRQDDLRQMEAQDIRELMNTHFEHIKEISIAGTDRIDALRVVDILAVATANEKAIKQAEVIATLVVESAKQWMSVLMQLLLR